MRQTSLKWKKGYTSSVQVGLTYTTQTTYADFQTNAVDGEIAIVKLADETIYSGSAVIPDGDSFFIVIKLGGQLNAQPPVIKGSNLRVDKQAGSAQVAQVSVIKITYPTASPNADSTQAYYVGTANEEERDFFAPEHGFYLTPKKSETYLALINRFVSAINDTTVEPNVTMGQRFTAGTVTNADNGDGTSYVQFKLTGVAYGGVQQKFSPVVSGFDDFVITTETGASQGVNLGVEVAEHEYDGGSFAGSTAYMNVLPPLEDIGAKPTALAVKSVTALYTSYLLTYTRSEMNSASTIPEHKNKTRNLYFVPNTATTVNTKLSTLLGV